MKIYEIVKLGGNLLNLLQKSCISMDDCKYLEMYEEYERLIACGAKRSMVATYLAEKYCICERRVYYLLKKFKTECNFDAVEKKDVCVNGRG